MFKRSDYKVYKLKTIDQTIIYIGRTGRSVQERFSEHLNDKFWIGEVEEVEECYIGSEADASITENIYINKLKPIFNKKDKFTGHTKIKPEPAFKKFSHAFYVFNKKITTCVPTFEEGYTLVDIIEMNGKDIGVYYDAYLNLYYSATDIMSLLDLEVKTVKESNKNILTKVTYSSQELGRQKTLTNHLCDINGAWELCNLASDDLLKVFTYNKIYDTYCKADMLYKWGSEAIVENVKEEYKEAMISLPEERYNSPHVMRRLAYKANSEDLDIINVVFDFNRSISQYVERVQLESFSCEIYSMIQDIIVEHSTEYRHVSEVFYNQLKDKGINVFALKGSVGKQYDMNPRDITLHFLISARREALYDHFSNFYDACME